MREKNAMYFWPEERWAFVEWQRDSRSYLKCTDAPSYLVRGAAASTLGAQFRGCLLHGNRVTAPVFAETFAFLQKEEQTRAGVAGPFLCGAYWSIDEWARESQFNFKRWFLETLKTSSREPQIPHLLTLEFYAHELFDSDADAIQQMLDMGRDYLAVLTATESPQYIDRLYPLLTRMSKSKDPRIANAIQMYLRERLNHAGMEFMREIDD